MNKFEIPELEIVYLGKNNVVATSQTCICVDCKECPEGKDNCPCYDFPGANQNSFSDPLSVMTSNEIPGSGVPSNPADVQSFTPQM